MLDFGGVVYWRVNMLDFDGEFDKDTDGIFTIVGWQESDIVLATPVGEGWVSSLSHSIY